MCAGGRAAFLAAGVIAVTLSVAGATQAGAWNKARGESQVIVKLEVMRASEGFDPDGVRLPLPAERRDDIASVLGEHGLSDRLTLIVRTDYQRGEDAFVRYEGLGTSEIGLQWQVWRDDRWALALSTSLGRAGEGRGAGYAPPGVGETEREVRLLAGRSFGHGSGRLDGWLDGAFAEVQVARRWRSEQEDETRLDVTVGLRPHPRWLLLSQVYAGEVAGGGPAWANTEISAVREIGSWSFQLGYRTALAGREVPAQTGPVIGIWRRF